MVEMSFEAELNIKVGGVAGGGSWNPVTIASDVMCNITAEEVDVSTRGGGGYKATQAGLIDLSVDGEIRLVPGNARYQELRDAFLERGVIGVQAFDANGEGYQFDAQVLEFSRSENLSEGMNHSFVLKPTTSDTPPEWIEPA
jgi:hypothetical protein